jgi:hypothetical protein
MNNRLIKSNDAGGGGCTNTVDLYNPFPDGGGVALYQLNGDATDVSGNYDGTATNVTWGGAGQFGTAANFSVSGSRIVLPTPSIIPVNLNFSLSIWIKGLQIASSVSNTVYLNFDGSYFGFTVESNNVIAAFSNSSSEPYLIATTSAPLDANSWNHVVISSAGLSGNCSIYVNGNFEASGTLQSTTRTISIANGNAFGDIPGVISYPFNGEIDQVRIFNRALRPYEVEALYTEEYCTPTIVPSEHFNTVLYTGNGGTQSITGVGFEPDFVWIKDRFAAEWHGLVDSVRGSSQVLYSNASNAENSGSDVTSFDSNGFSLTNSNNFTNRNGDSYVAWNFKAGGNSDTYNVDGVGYSTAAEAGISTTGSNVTLQGASINTEAGFSIITFAGGSSYPKKVPHGLGVVPKLTISWTRNVANDPIVMTTVVNGTEDYLILNSTGTLITSTRSADSSIFDIVYSDNADYVSYCFAEVEGFSSFGSYVGTGSSVTQSIVTGFEPAFVIIKDYSAGGSWFIEDNKRGAEKSLKANSSDAESTPNYVEFLENGFTVTNGLNDNSVGSKFIYMAFAADPTTVEPTLEDSFNTVTYTGDGTLYVDNPNPITGVGFQPDFTWIKSRTSTLNHTLCDSVRGAGNVLYPNLTNGEVTASTPIFIDSFDSDGFTVNALHGGNTNENGVDFVAWNWKGAELPAINSNGSIPSVVSANPAAGFSIVSYTGSGANATVGHGLSDAPSVIIAKRREDSGYNWAVYHKDLTNASYYLWLNSTQAEAIGTNIWNSTDPTSSVFSVGTSSNINTDNKNYIAYCFAEVAGFSKFGSYVGGTGSVTVSDVGFKPLFVMIKNTDTAASWIMFDTIRSAGDLANKTLYADSSNQEATVGTAYITMNDNGFIVNNSTSFSTNKPGDTYIYMAFANQF